MNQYQRGIVIGAGALIFLIQANGIHEYGLDSSPGWYISFLISACLLFLGCTSNTTFTALTDFLLFKLRGVPPAVLASSVRKVVQPPPQANPATNKYKYGIHIDEATIAIEEHLGIAKLEKLHDSLAGTGKSLQWCCALSVYASMRFAARKGGLSINLMVWNTITRSMMIAMLKNEAKAGDPVYQNLEKEAYAIIDTVDKIIDDTQGKELTKIVNFLSLQFGCSEQPKKVSALKVLFAQNADIALQKIIPEYLEDLN